MTKTQLYFVENQDGVHLVGPFSDYTLCGDTMDGDQHPSIDIQPMRRAEQSAVTCKKCIKIIRLCQNVKYKE